MDGSRHPEFAAKLLKARKRTGKSQERLAAEIGTSRRHYIRWENGDHIPSPEFLVRIGEAVGQPEEFDPDDDAEVASMAAGGPLMDALTEALRAFVRAEMTRSIS